MYKIETKTYFALLRIIIKDKEITQDFIMRWKIRGYKLFGAKDIFI